MSTTWLAGLSLATFIIGSIVACVYYSDQLLWASIAIALVLLITATVKGEKP